MLRLCKLLQKLAEVWLKSPETHCCVWSPPTSEPLMSNADVDVQTRRRHAQKLSANDFVSGVQRRSFSFTCSRLTSIAVPLPLLVLFCLPSLSACVTVRDPCRGVLNLLQQSCDSETYYTHIPAMSSPVLCTCYFIFLMKVEGRNSLKFLFCSCPTSVTSSVNSSGFRVIFQLLVGL